jgi:hypothetical protein
VTFYITKIIFFFFFFSNNKKKATMSPNRYKTQPGTSILITDFILPPLVLFIFGEKITKITENSKPAKIILLFCALLFAIITVFAILIGNENGRIIASMLFGLTMAIAFMLKSRKIKE